MYQRGMTKSCDTILFDLDGTLIHSAPDVCHWVNEVFAEQGFAPMSVETMQGYLGQGARVLMAKAVADHGYERSDDILDQMTADFLARYAAQPVLHSSVYPGVFDVLDRLRAEEAIIAICTNKPSKTTAPVLDALGLGGRFDAIVCSDQVARKKPHGDHVLDTVKACGGDVARTVMVGDSENDIDAAIAAEVPSIAVTFGYSNKPVHELGADQLIDGFDQFFDALAAIRA